MCNTRCMESVTSDAHPLLRASITRDELRALKAQAAMEGKTVQDLLAELIRQRITTREG